MPHASSRETPAAFASPKPQEKRLKGLGATIPPHAAVQAKRDREWREFLERRTGDPSSVATVRKEKQRFGDEVRFRFPREWVVSGVRPKSGV